MKVLIVDDEPLIRSVIREYCLASSFEVMEAENGLEAITLASNPSVDVMILDLMMPKLDGYSAYKKIKEIRDLPTIILSARKEEYDKLIGFDLGIDDYLTKPFSPKELIARIKAVMKRYQEEDIELKEKDLIVDLKGHVARIKDEVLKLTPKEYELLVYFLQNKNIALSREQLLSKLWGYDFFGDDRTIDTHIKMLRSNLGSYRDCIVTVRGMGYKFVSEP